MKLTATNSTPTPPAPANDSYLKVNFPPYLFELDLLHPIDHQASIASVGNGVVKFTLAKVIRRPASSLVTCVGAVIVDCMHGYPPPPITLHSTS